MIRKGNPSVTRWNKAMPTEPSESLLRRWAQIKRFSTEQIARIHKVETRHWESTEGPERHGYIDASASLFHAFNDELGPFWSPRTTKEIRENQNKLFSRRIFTIWRPLWNRVDAAMDSPRKEDARVELDVIHMIDTAVNADPFPYPSNSSGSSGMNALKEKTEKDPEDMYP